MEEGPEMALRRWNFVMAEGRGRLFPLSRFIFDMTGSGGIVGRGELGGGL